MFIYFNIQVKNYRSYQAVEYTGAGLHVPHHFSVIFRNRITVPV